MVYVLLVAALGISLLGVPSARADGEVTVTFDTMTPGLLDPSDPTRAITLTGTVRNGTGLPLKDVNVHFWRSLTPLTSLDELETALESSPDEPKGSRLTGQAHLMSFPSLEPGASASFQVEATISDLTSTEEGTVHLLGVHVRATGADGNRRTVGRGRILAPLTSSPLPVASVVKLTHRPTLIGDTEFQDGSLGQALTHDLGKLLSAAEEPGRVALVDPALFVELQALAEPHLVAGQEQPASPDAQRFLARLQTLVREQRALRLPYGNPDLPRLYASGALSDFETALGWSATALERAELPEVAALPLAADLGKYANEDLSLILARSGFARIFADNLVSSGCISTSTTIGYAVDPLDRPGMGPGTSTSPIQLTQRRLAEELLADDVGVHLARDVTDLALLPLVPDAETSAALPTPRETASFPVNVTKDSPWQLLLNRSKSLFTESELLQELTGTDQTGVNATTAALANSADFSHESEALAFITAHTREQLDASQIRLSSASQFVMGSDRNVFPMTISNPLTVPIRLRVVFSSDSPTRLSIPASEVVTIAPGEQQTVSVTPVAKANGVVTVHAQLITPNGTRFGSVIPVEVTATGFGRVGWIIITVSGAVVLGGTLWRIRTVQKETTHRKQAKESREQ